MEKKPVKFKCLYPMTNGSDTKISNGPSGNVNHSTKFFVSLVGLDEDGNLVELFKRVNETHYTLSRPVIK